VFLALARKAARLADGPVLKGWLHTAARFSANQVVRTERRRQAREQEAHMRHELNDDPAPQQDSRELRSIIDEVIGALNERDRAVVLLRFFEDRTFPDIGARLGMSADGARLRVDRALDKLSGLLAARGIKSTATALAACLAEQAAIAAPASHAPAIVGAVATGAGAGGILAGGGLAGGLQFFVMTKAKTTVLGGIAVALAATVTIQQRTHAALRTQRDALEQTAQQLEPLRSENARLARIAAEAVAMQADQAEIAQVRAQLAEAKNRAKKNDPVEQTGQITSRLVPIEELRNRGNSTAAAAFETLYWAKQQMDIETIEKLVALSPESRARLLERFNALTPEQRATVPWATTPERMAFVSWMRNNPETAISVNTDTAINDERTYLSGHRQDARGLSNFDLLMTRTAEGWKWLPAENSNSIAAALKIQAKPGQPPVAGDLPQISSGPKPDANRAPVPNR
jgi:RNA polymerase sigma factor (sigma-70 family)